MNNAKMDRRFSGVIKLYGYENYRKLQNSHVIIVGIGGVGSWAAEALARSGIGSITLVDLDNIAESNINRQTHSLVSTIGKSKVEVMSDRIAEINPECNVRAIEDFLSYENIDSLIQTDCNSIIDCIDQVDIKVELSLYSVRNKLPLIVCGSAGGKTDVLKLLQGDISIATNDPILSKMRNILRRKYGFPTHVIKRNNKKSIPNMGITALWINQQIIIPSLNCDRGFTHNLSCSGYGSIVTVTATMGFVGANIALNNILNY
ncbi:family 1 dinucleotide-utilizing molybdopterin and thiamine biosynthesis protein [Candidatus Kinetoplastibacterium blastocrithidii TCC012E]|uniref:Family 1 dinucleotide-utilizing molybdopterin and thiamine biosynthesis protein n=1 Tax=Candidatus Kinetoplastidibacterium blastocrithidiae TCC012E TaxID=1208922 RepID=M1ME18_9PROT|nr:tRNA threonylcarbamoyladenosine dehydratase [Candidatus Kinetoplastibacterium blastocrithidii]AFZ83856.1 ThiF family protein [Candidatus Kinetoplastibacterium blastocrithidii (ex Strigomonas culicis)]AGF49975.1 family 1 dinucleotide-utilizing molybdopterin and thiamine biosynthesis protein [Candidatus Kinetoplastibacterium blastocrithidii TCC012E]